MTASGTPDRLYLAQRKRLNLTERVELVHDLIASGPLGIRSAILTPELGDVAPKILAALAPEESIRAAEGPLLEPSTPFTIKRHIVRVLVELVQRPHDGIVAMEKRAEAAVAAVSRDWGPPNLYHRRLNDAAVTMIRAAAGLSPTPDVRALLCSKLEDDILRGLSLASLAGDPSLVPHVLRLRNSARNEIAYAASRALEVIEPDRHSMAGTLERELQSGSRGSIEEAIGMARRTEDGGCVPVMLAALPHRWPRIQTSLLAALRSWPHHHPAIDAFVCSATADACPRRRAIGAEAANPFIGLPTLRRLRMLERDPAPEVRRQAFHAVLRHHCADEGRLDAISAALADTSPELRQAASKAIRDLPADAAGPMAETALGDRDPSVRATAVASITRMHKMPVDWRSLHLRQASKDRASQVAIAALAGLITTGQQADTAHAARGMRRLTVEDQLEVLKRLAFSLAQPGINMRPLLRSPHAAIVERVCSLLAAQASPGVLRRMLIDALPRARGAGGRALLKRIGRKIAPSDIKDLGALASARSGPVRALATRLHLQIHSGPPDPGWVLARVEDQAPEVRAAVLARAHARLEAPTRDAIFAKLLADPTDRIAFEALRRLGPEESSRQLDGVIEILARDGCTVELARAAVAHLYQALPDPRAVGALTSLLATDQEEVALPARSALRRFEHSRGPLDDWRGLVREVREARLWGEQAGRRLAGARVRVLPLMSGLGRTISRERGDPALVIWINDGPITCRAPHGADIVRGLIVHELGHHLWDIGQPGHDDCRKRAYAAAFGGVYDLLIDERLERHMRSVDPGFAACLDRLAAHAFARRTTQVSLQTYARTLDRSEDDVRAALERAELPGAVDPRTIAGSPMVNLSMIDLLRVPDLADPWQAFMLCLRGGHDPRLFASEQVREALAILPRDLRHAPHREVLESARAIAAHLIDEPGTRARGRSRKALLRGLAELEGQLAALVRSVGRIDGEAAAPGPVGTGLESDGPAPGIAPGSKPPRRAPGGGLRWNNGRDPHFPILKIRDRSREPVDRAGEAELLAGMRGQVRTLRAHLERVGIVEVSEPGCRRGRRVDLATARRAGVVLRPDVLVHRREEQRADLYITVLIDRSGSMSGEKLERAKRFGMLLVEAARGIRGIDGHVCAFDSATFDILGDLRRHAIGALSAEGGNNDAAALATAVDLALASRRSRRAIVMISDGLPADCTLAALRDQVALATTRGILCAQVAVSPLPAIAFPHFVDLSSCQPDEAVDRFGRLLVELSRHGSSALAAGLRTIPGRKASPAEEDVERRRAEGPAEVEKVEMPF